MTDEGGDRKEMPTKSDGEVKHTYLVLDGKNFTCEKKCDKS
jgi:hypothetical protein